VIADICEAARAQLAADGAAALSLRSIARELGMVSSGIYRYVASRDELLTMLVISAYGDLADAVEAAVGGNAQSATRWLHGCRAVRAFALARPHEYALLYGTPVPGYAAPQDTIAPASRVYSALATPLTGRKPRAVAIPKALQRDADNVIIGLDLEVDRNTALRYLGAIAKVFGLVSLELFGHMTGVVTERDAFFDWTVRSLGEELGLA
jgi:AcrR family transcriptional regulator